MVKSSIPQNLSQVNLFGDAARADVETCLRIVQSPSPKAEPLRKVRS